MNLTIELDAHLVLRDDTSYGTIARRFFGFSSMLSPLLSSGRNRQKIRTRTNARLITFFFSSVFVILYPHN